MTSLQEQGHEPVLPRPRLADQHITLEIAFVDVPNDANWLDDVWSELDEQHLNPEFRRHMQANGFRSGIVGIQLPEKMRQQLDAGSATNQSDGQQETGNQVGTPVGGSRRLSLSPGKVGEIVTSGKRPSIIVLVDDDDSVVGTTYHEALTEFQLMATTLPDGRAELILSPEIRYGPTESRIVSGEGMFRIQAQQATKKFLDLTITAKLTAGQTLVLGTTGPSKSIGGNFFIHHGKQQLLLIRLAQSSLDDLCLCPEPLVASTAPLAKVAEKAPEIVDDAEPPDTSRSHSQKRWKLTTPLD